MTLAELRAYFRLKLQDAVPNYLWSDEEANSYINEAQKEAAVRSRCLYDRSSALCSFDTVADQSVYEISPLFFRLERVSVDGRPIEPTSLERLDSLYRGRLPPPGMPRYYFVDRAGALNLFRGPDAAYPVLIEGYRYPAPLLDDEDVCEIKEQYQLNMLSWAYKLAKEKEDPEAERQGDAQRHEADFERVFGKRVDIYAIEKHGQYSRRLMRYGGL